MAVKRMFSNRITDCDDFIDMPTSAQALYFHLCMHADDDGFVNSARRICRTVGASADDMNTLIGKRFVLSFGSVIVIKHWKIHNTIKRDRYSPTQYAELIDQLRVKENGAYTEKNKSGSNPEPNRNQTGSNPDPNRNRTGTGPELIRIQTGSNPEPKYSIGKYSIDKSSIDKDRVVESSIDKGNIEEDSIESNTDTNSTKRHPYGSCRNVLLTNDECKSLVEAYGNETTKEAVEFLSLYIKDKGYKSESHYAAIRRWVVNAVRERKPENKFNFEQRNTDYDAILSSGSEGGQA